MSTQTIRLIALAALLLGTAACGNKGPLYLPQSASQAPVENPAESAAQTQTAAEASGEVQAYAVEPSQGVNSAK